MSTTITASGSPTFKHATTGPSDGPTAHVSDVNNPFQDVLDNTEYLYQASHGFSRIVGIASVPYNAANTRSTTSSTPTTVAAATLTLACVAGDVIDIDAMLIINNNAIAKNGRLQIYISENGGGFVALANTVTYNLASATVDGHVPMKAFYTVVATGNVIIRIYSWAADNTNDVDVTLETMRAIAYRAAAP